MIIARANETAIPPAVSGARKNRTQDDAGTHLDVIRRWRPRGRLARWLGFLDHEDAIATPSGTSIPNALARYRVSLLQMRAGPSVFEPPRTLICTAHQTRAKNTNHALHQNYHSFPLYGDALP